MYSAERYAVLAVRRHSVALWANSPKEDCRKIYRLVLTYKSFLESFDFTVYTFEDIALLSWR